MSYSSHDFLPWPGTEERRKSDVNMTHSSQSTDLLESKTGFGVRLRDMPEALLLLSKNPVFVCQCLAFTIHAFLITGISTFIVKFMANQYNMQTGQAAMLIGNYHGYAYSLYRQLSQHESLCVIR